MTSRIRPLPDDVVNRIAAGEVVERPASVLKELLENAVDSGAGSIEADVSGPFPFTLRVTDDGCGMSREEAELAVRRHTTSKIASADDLDRIGSLRVPRRGAPVDRLGGAGLRRHAARRKSAAGRNWWSEGGTILSVREAGAPQGTTVTVSGLFENVPARRKFLKSERTEMSHLWDVFHGVAIPGEGISFRFTDPRGAFAYESRESALDRAKRHAGDDGQYLVPVDVSSAFFRIFGWAGLPQVSRAGAGGLWFFVNGRRFRDRGLYAAVREAYRGILPGDRLPVLYLFVTCSPRRGRRQRPPGEDGGPVPVSARPERAGAPRPRRGARGGAVARGDPHPRLGGTDPAGRAPAGGIAAGHVARGRHRFPLPPSGDGVERAWDAAVRRTGRRGDPGAILFLPRPDRAGAGDVSWSARTPDGIVLVDQHAADERIVFSRLKDRYLGKRAPDAAMARLRGGRAPGGPVGDGRAPGRGDVSRPDRILLRAGGGERIRLTGGPAALPGFDARRWWEELCESLRAQETLPKDLFDADRELWRMACHTAVRGGERVTTERARLLLAELDAAIAAHSCPHGRPVWIRISRARLEALFHRTG